MALPPILPDSKVKPRRFASELSPSEWMALESQATKRGVTAYKLVSLVLAAWLRGELVERSPSPSSGVSS